MNILAIESSCDETCAAVVTDGRFIKSNIVASQIDTHALYGGVVPEIASRAHAEAISCVVSSALNDADMELCNIDAIAVTNEPGLIGALLVGVNFAKTLAYGISKPLIPVHHIKGHIAANYTYFNGEDGREFLEPPYTAIVVSGGHTSLVNVNSYTDFEVVGSTRDDAAGESFDKVARMLGLPYPGGAKMDARAKNGNPHAFTFPDTKVKNSIYDFSFSGLKTCAVNMIHNASQKGENISVDDLSASFTRAIVNTIVSRTELIFKDENKRVSDKLVLAGGVAANSHLRSALQDMCDKNNIRFFVPPISLCGDNAVMIGAQAYYEFINSKDKNFYDLSLNAYASSEF